MRRALPLLCVLISISACASRHRSDTIMSSGPSGEPRTVLTSTGADQRVATAELRPPGSYQRPVDALQRRLDVALAARDVLRRRFVAWGAIPRPPRPEPLIEEPGEPPVAGARWIPGKWVWANGRWEWREGYWLEPDAIYEGAGGDDPYYLVGDLDMASVPAIRDHRNGKNDRVRDHRDGKNDRVRDHRDDDTPTVRDHRDDTPTPTPTVRDHRDSHDDTPTSTVRDHRDDKSSNDDDDRNTRIRDHRR